jgi:hypothetical protein
VQKYIEKPVLFKERKFDLRVWALLMSDGSVWYFKEGYVRTSSETFTLLKTADEDLQVHLTNNAV